MGFVCEFRWVFCLFLDLGVGRAFCTVGMMRLLVLLCSIHFPVHWRTPIWYHSDWRWALFPVFIDDCYWPVLNLLFWLSDSLCCSGTTPFTGTLHCCCYLGVRWLPLLFHCWHHSLFCTLEARCCSVLGIVLFFSVTVFVFLLCWRLVIVHSHLIRYDCYGDAPLTRPLQCWFHDAFGDCCCSICWYPWPIPHSTVILHYRYDDPCGDIVVDTDCWLIPFIVHSDDGGADAWLSRTIFSVWCSCDCWWWGIRVLMFCI